MMNRLLRASLPFALVFFAASLSAQLITEEVPRARTVPQREQVRQQLEESRYTLGFFRFDPVFELRDVGYNNNVLGSAGNEVGDWTATVGAGLRGIAPVGRKVFVRLDAVPSYHYYHELDERRHFGGRYGANLLMLFNRFSLEGGASRNDTVEPISSELERPIRRTLDRQYARAEIDILRRLSVFGGVETQSPRFDAQSDDDRLVEILDREESAVRGGVRYRFRSYFDVSIAAEETTSEFELDPTRDFDTNAVILGVHYDRPRMFVNLFAGRRNAEVAARGIEMEETTGSYYLAREVGARSEIQFFGRRRLVPALFQENPFFIESRNGAALQLQTGSRSSIRFSAETGRNDYPQPVVFQLDSVQRSDDVVSYGAGLQIRLYRRVAFQVNATQTDYDANIAGFDRSILRYTTGIVFLGDTVR